MVRSPTFFALLTSLVAACAAPSPGLAVNRPATGARPASEANGSLALALQGRWVNLLPKGVWVSHPSSEYFCPNGIYLRQSYRGTSVGTYQLEGLELCVAEGTYRYCRTFQPTGDSYEIVTSEGTATIDEVVPAWGTANAPGCDAARGGGPDD